MLWALALKGALWAPALLYGLWLLADRNTPRRGGRRSEWVRKWTVWRYFRDYFPISVSPWRGGGGPQRGGVVGDHKRGGGVMGVMKGGFRVSIGDLGS